MSYSLSQNLQGTREGDWEADSLECSYDCPAVLLPDWPGAPGPTAQPPRHLEIIGSSGTSLVVQRLILTLPLQGTQVGSSVGKLRSHTPCGIAKKNLKNKIKTWEALQRPCSLLSLASTPSPLWLCLVGKSGSHVCAPVQRNLRKHRVRDSFWLLTRLRSQFLNVKRKLKSRWWKERASLRTGA